VSAASGVACIVGEVRASDGESIDGCRLCGAKGLCCGAERAAGRCGVVHQQDTLASEATRAGWRHTLERAMDVFAAVCR
jgi:hypothetical protein